MVLMAACSVAAQTFDLDLEQIGGPQVTGPGECWN